MLLPETMKTRALNQLIFAATIAICFPAKLLAHGLEPHEPTAEEMAKVEEPIPGTDEFVAELSRHGRALFNKSENEQLSHIVDDLDVKRHQLRENPSNKDVPRFHHHRAEVAMVALLEKYQGLIRHDFAGGKSSDLEMEVPLNSHQDLILVKVVTGPGPKSFVVSDINLRQDELKLPGAEVLKSGTAYVLLRLSEVPKGRSFVLLGYRVDGSEKPVHARRLTLIREPEGTLDLTVTDEFGKPCPVLIRLTAASSGRLAEPDSALDFREQLNEITGLDKDGSLGIYGPGKAYVAPIPGPLAGPYWVIDGKEHSPLTAGEWELILHRGTEYEPVRQKLTIRPNETTTLTVQLKRWIDFRKKGWYSGDDHVHARLMSEEDAKRLMSFTRAADIHVANILEMGDSARTWYPQRGYGKDHQTRHGDHVLVVGQEDPRSALGHAIGLNLPSIVRDLDRYLLNDLLAKEMHEKGGLYGHTHVGANACFVHREMALFTPMGIVDFNSIVQRRLGLELYYDFLNMGFKMTASAGSDTPYGAVLGTSRVYTQVGNEKPFTPQAWFDALKAGRSFATNGPLLEFEVNGKLPGEEIVVNPGSTVRVSITGYGASENWAPKEVRLVVLGESFRSSFSDDPKKSSLKLEAEVPVGHGAWIAAHVIGHDGSEAHSTPIYVKCEGFRHWNVTKAEAVIDKQIAVLAEIDDVVDKAKEAYTNNPNSMWDRWLVEQGPQVKERTTNVRKHYQEMKSTLAKEIQERNK